MRDIESSFSQSQSFLPLESSILAKSDSIALKKQKKQKHHKKHSILFDELKKINNENVTKKRQCIIKYLKKQGSLKDTSKIISTVQQEGHAIPILQVAVSLCRYDNQFLKELMDSNSIELKQSKQSEIYQINKKLQSDPILSLLSDSQQLKKIPQQPKQASFIDFKHISPTKKNQLIDVDKGKFKRSKQKCFSMIEYPEELKNLKSQLLSLPYIHRYKNILSRKAKLKTENQTSFDDALSLKKSNYSEIENLSDLNASKRSFKDSFISNQKISQLQTNLKTVIENRVKNVDILISDVILPKVNKNLRKHYQNSLMSIKQDYPYKKSSTQNQQTYQYQTIRDSAKYSEQNPEQYGVQMKASIKRKSTIRKNLQKQYWPTYKNYSPFNNKKHVTQIQKLKSKVKSFTQLSQIPSQQTLSVYYSLKKLQNNDLKKLQKQSLIEQKRFSNTKYKIKYNSLKETYSKRLKQFIKDKQVQQFQLQQNAYQQASNLMINQVKLNSKKLQKLVLPQKQQK